MFTKILSSFLAIGMIASSAMAKDTHRGVCYITIAPESGPRVDKVVDLNPNDIPVGDQYTLGTDLGDVGGFKMVADYTYMDDKGYAYVHLDVTTPEGVEQNFQGKDSILWTVFNYKGSYISVGCGEKTTPAK